MCMYICLHIYVWGTCWVPTQAASKREGHILKGVQHICLKETPYALHPTPYTLPEPYTPSPTPHLSAIVSVSVTVSVSWP